MRILPWPTSARRMAILICVVGAIDAAAAYFIAKPLLWCATIPGLIPLLTPVAIFSRDSVHRR